MDLMSWRKRAGLNRAEVAAMLGVSVWTVGRYENRLQPSSYLPPRDLIARIIEMSEGQVLPNDLFGEAEIAMILQRVASAA